MMDDTAFIQALFEDPTGIACDSTTRPANAASAHISAGRGVLPSAYPSTTETLSMAQIFALVYERFDDDVLDTTVPPRGPSPMMVYDLSAAKSSWLQGSNNLGIISSPSYAPVQAGQAAEPLNDIQLEAFTESHIVPSFDPFFDSDVLMMAGPSLLQGNFDIGTDDLAALTASLFPDAPLGVTILSSEVAVPPQQEVQFSPQFTAEEQQTVSQYMLGMADQSGVPLMAGGSIDDLFDSASSWFAVASSPAMTANQPVDSTNVATAVEISTIPEQVQSTNTAASCPSSSGIHRRVTASNATASISQQPSSLSGVAPVPLPGRARCRWGSCMRYIGGRDIKHVQIHLVHAHPDGKRWQGKRKIRCQWEGCIDGHDIPLCDVAAHVVKAHLREHECAFSGCGEVFHSKDHLNRHVRMVHHPSLQDVGAGVPA